MLALIQIQSNESKFFFGSPQKRRGMKKNHLFPQCHLCSLSTQTRVPTNIEQRESETQPCFLPLLMKQKVQQGFLLSSLFFRKTTQYVHTQGKVLWHNGQVLSALALSSLSTLLSYCTMHHGQPCRRHDMIHMRKKDLFYYPSSVYSLLPTF